MNPSWGGRLVVGFSRNGTSSAQSKPSASAGVIDLIVGKKNVFFVLLSLFLAGCSISNHITYKESELNGKKPAILFVSKNIHVSIDGKAFPRGFFGGLYQGGHYYLTPGEHKISYNCFWGGGSYIYSYRQGFDWMLSAKENMYYKLLNCHTPRNQIAEMEMPEKLPRSPSDVE